MHGLSSGTGRFAAPKIEFTCSCGKRYRVAATKAGKKVRCKRCKVKVQVPGSRRISMRSRKAILAEFGIDADQAEQAYQAEKQDSYRCAICSTKLADDSLKDAYGEAGLVCSDCRAAQIADRGQDYKQADESSKKKRKSDKGLDSWTSDVDVDAVKRKAWAIAIVSGVGLAGMMTTFGLSAWIAVPVALGIAAAAGKSVVRAETA